MPVSWLRIWKAWLQTSDPHDVLLDDGFLRMAISNGIKATLHAYLYDDAQHTGSIVDMPVFLMRISDVAVRKSTVKWYRVSEHNEFTIMSSDFTDAVRWIWVSTGRRVVMWWSPVAPSCTPPFTISPSTMSNSSALLPPSIIKSGMRQISYHSHQSFCPSEVWHPPPSTPSTLSDHHDFSFHCIPCWTLLDRWSIRKIVGQTKGLLFNRELVQPMSQRRLWPRTSSSRRRSTRQQK